MTHFWNLAVAARLQRACAAVLLGAMLLWGAIASNVAQAQAPAAGGDPSAAAPASMDEAERRANEALATPPAGNAAATTAPAANAADSDYIPSILELAVKGGWFMIPIALMSLLGAVFSIERILAIRRAKILPPDLVGALGAASQDDGGLDPRKVYKACQQFPSPAANVIRSAMLKVGRPHAEVEQTVKDAMDREAEKVFKNVRPILLATTVSPLLGLLGTVWGLVNCFARLASGVDAQNKMEQLSSGIYPALMTTVFGLCVAIPGSMIAHWLEGKIQAIFREIEELMLNIMPQMERFEGKLRIQRKGSESAERPASDRAAGDRPAGDRRDERGKPQVAVD